LFLKNSLREDYDRKKKEVDKKVEELGFKETALRAKLEAEKEAQIRKELGERAFKLKAELRDEYKNKLKMEMKKKESELEAKKIALEQEIQRKAKLLFS
ncbi:MAG: hypothetical protein WCP89_04550, partial [archaeon]